VAHELAYLKQSHNEDGVSLIFDDWVDKRGGSREWIERLVANFCKLFKHFTRQTVAGFFPVGPIRELHQSDICKMAPRVLPSPKEFHPATPEYTQHANSEEGDERPYADMWKNLRWVGIRGEYTQELFGYFAYNSMSQVGEPAMTYWVETFVSYWLENLTRTRVELAEFPDGRPDQQILKSDLPLNGVMKSSNWDWDRRAVTVENAPKSDNGFQDFSRSLRPMTSELPAGWHVMSTGFHQITPIVVQACFLRKNEIMAVENPEAHLHPSLQVKMAEFLMHQANAGKFMVIETHSDLFVRRVLRAIREEEVSPGNVFKQSSVGINFTRLDGKHAILEELKVDDQGQIRNWPPGFLDDDGKESRKLFDAMYGTQSEEDDDAP
jgi:hypothetical protein